MLFTLALRNLWRNRRRSLLTLSAMVVSSSLLILCLGVFSGMFADMLASATEQYHGHIVISGQNYQEDRDLYTHFPDAASTIDTILSHPRVIAAAPRVRSFGLISHAMDSQPGELLGISPAQERLVTTLNDYLIAGSALENGSTKGTLIGSGMAKKLGVEVGAELVVLTQASDGSIGNDLLQVRGIFATGSPQHDNGLVLVHIDWLRELLALPEVNHEIALRVVEPLVAAQIADELASEINGELEILDWGDLLPQMAEAIAAYDVSRLIMVTILYLATGLGILNTFFMSVLERTREFGVLMALGVRPWRIRLLVLAESLFLGLFALVFGVLLALAMTLYMGYVGIDLSGNISPISYAGGTILPRLHAVLVFDNFFIPAILLLAVSLLAGFLPANRAAKLRPVEALREE